MKNIFLAPRSNETSHENFVSTIIGGRPFGFFESFLNEKEKGLFSKDTPMYVWGTKESLRNRWKNINPGDYVLFYQRGVFNYSARVVCIKYDFELGKKLWPVDTNGEPWPCLFFIENLKTVNIPVGLIRELAGYEPTW